MRAEVYKAWFLRSRASGDTSLRTSFLTEELGIVEALYKGGRSPKKKVCLQPFTPLWVSLNLHRDSFYVRHIESDTCGFSLSGQALFSGLYVNELLYLMHPPQESSSILFNTYVASLEALSLGGGRLVIEPVLRRFERTLLTISGYSISFMHDAESGLVIQPNSYYQFIPGLGFVLSSSGYSGAHLLALSEDNLKDSEVLAVAKQIMRTAIHHATDGKEIYSRKLFAAAALQNK